MKIKLEIGKTNACIDGLTRVSHVAPFIQMFPQGSVYGGGICLWFDDYPIEDIREKLKNAGYSVEEKVVYE